MPEKTTEKSSNDAVRQTERATGQRRNDDTRKQTGKTEQSGFAAPKKRIINALLDGGTGAEKLHRQRPAQNRPAGSGRTAPRQNAKKQDSSAARPQPQQTARPQPQQTARPQTRKVSDGKVSDGKSAQNKNTRKNETKSFGGLKIIPLGGLGEIGKNLTVYEFKNDIIIVDCGLSFPSDEMLGVDIVIPDFSYLVANAEKIRGAIITHGHEDHIGGIPYLLKQLNIPIYGTALTLGLIKCKLQEHGLLESAKLNTIKAGDRFKLGVFGIEAINVNHSIPDAVAFAITTPAGTIIQTGDFKIDATPINGETINLARFSELGKKGVLALLMDSTNATRPGFTMSERTVGYSFSHFFKEAQSKRIIVASFSSNIHRIQQIVDEAVKCRRKVCVVGRSMENAVNVATELGYLNIPDGVLISIDQIRSYADNELVIITTGSQGEPMSALHRMAFGDHRKVKVGPNDLIIVSATPIPGNEKLVSTVINELLKLGAKVIYERMYDVHVSGHACQEELKLMLSLIKPKFFMPVHGEQMHLEKNAELAKEVGIPEKNILITEIGRVTELTSRSMKNSGSVISGCVLVDGLGVGDVGSVVLRDRKHLAEDGIIIAAITIDSVTGEVLSGPDLVSRGFVYVKESEALMDNAKTVVCKVLDKCATDGTTDWTAIKTAVKDRLSSYLYEKTRRSPMILPIIMQV